MSAVDRFVETMGVITQEGGDSRIAGRIIGLLVAEGRELSLNQISERLSVSRASVSTNARQLARRGVIKRTAHSGDRQDYYELTGLPFFDILGELALQFERHARTIGQCVEGMRDEDPPAASRAGEVQDFFEKSAEILHDWAAALRDDPAPRKDKR